MMAINFVQNIVISMKSTNMPISILPKTNCFKVLCVFITNHGVDNEKSEIRGYPGVLKMLTMEKNKKPKLTIYIRQLLFIMELYYSTLNNDTIHYQLNTNAGADWFFLFVCFLTLTQHNSGQWNDWATEVGQKTRIGVSMSPIIIVIFLFYLPLSTCICCWG